MGYVYVLEWVTETSRSLVEIKYKLRQKEVPHPDKLLMNSRAHAGLVTYAATKAVVFADRNKIKHNCINSLLFH